jgi:hypothetical protein
MGLSISNYRPSYISNTTDTEAQWMTEYNPWGAWHKANGRAYKELRCFGVELIANSHGARDKERKIESKKSRVVVLGDSFVEGFGVSAHQRFTNKLEEFTGRPFLNFGASGDFGPLQYSILYQKLASKFDHSEVLVAILPDNDFTDNDPAHWIKINEAGYQQRYRPYWKQKNSNMDFSYFYPVKHPEQQITFADYRKKGGTAGASLKNRLQRFTWTYGVYRELRYYTRGSSLTAGTYSGYFDFSQQQLAATLYYLKQIKDNANGKPVSFFTIPRLSDLIRLQSEKSPLVQKLKEFAAANELSYIDLSESMIANTKKVTELFLPCDGHWSAFGHSVATEILSSKLFNHKN